MYKVTTLNNTSLCSEVCSPDSKLVIRYIPHIWIQAKIEGSSLFVYRSHGLAYLHAGKNDKVWEVDIEEERKRIKFIGEPTDEENMLDVAYNRKRGKFMPPEGTVCVLKVMLLKNITGKSS